MRQDDITDVSDGDERTIVTNAQGYREVSLHYRQSRSSKLRQKPLAKDRLHCPMVDAARSRRAYGVQTLRDTSKQAIIEWAQGMGSDDKFAFLIIAYLSGPLTAVPRNIWTGRFEEEQLNSGLITHIKDGINTGIIAKGYFDQAVFDALISKVHPQFEGKTLDEDNLYTDNFAEVYLLESDLHPILAHNLGNQISGGIRKFIGKKISKFEMGSLLLGLLSQPIKQQQGDSKTVNAMLVRDLFDFYKYGWFPAPIEESFISAGLLKTPLPIPQ